MARGRIEIRRVDRPTPDLRQQDACLGALPEQRDQLVVNLCDHVCEHVDVRTQKGFGVLQVGGMRGDAHVGLMGFVDDGPLQVRISKTSGVPSARGWPDATRECWGWGVMLSCRRQNGGIQTENRPRHGESHRPKQKPLIGQKVDVIFIGSCTNSRISDMREAAKIFKGRKVSESVRPLIVPGSEQVRAEAESEGLDRIITVFLMMGVKRRVQATS